MRKKKLSGLLYLFCYILLNQAILAQDKDTLTIKELNELSIEELLNLDLDIQITKKKGEDIFHSPASITVIDKNFIEAYDIQTLTEALSAVSGVMIYRTYLKKDLPTIRGILQDHYANKVLIMINGIPTWHAITGEGNLNRISVQDIERIEVLRGPASIQYGTNAFSGAINLILKNQSSPGVEAHAGMGNEKHYSCGVNVNAEKNDLSLFASGNAYNFCNSDNYFVDSDQEDGYVDDISFAQNFNLVATWKSHNFLFNSYRSTEGFFGVLPKYANGAGKNQNLEGYLLNFNGETKFFEKISINKGMYMDFNKRDISRLRDDSIHSDISGYRVGAYLTGFYDIIENLSFELGGDMDFRYSLSYNNYIVQSDSVITDNNLKYRKSLEGSLYSQIHFKVGSLSSTLGGRLTNNKNFGTHISTHASLSFLLNEKSSIKLLYGSSYRVPSLFEMYFTNPQHTVFGNDQLTPEKSHSVELALLNSFNRFYLQFLVYYAQYEDKIERVNDSVFFENIWYYNQSVYKNAGVFNATGIEAEIRYSNPGFISGFVNYNCVFGTKDDMAENEDHYNFKYVPQHTVNLGLQKNFLKHFSISGIYHFYSEMRASVSTIKPQHICDLNLQFDHKVSHQPIRHCFSVKNILDANFVLPDYSSRSINDIPYGTCRTFIYTLKININ